MATRKITRKVAIKVVGKLIRKDREVWRVASDGAIRTIRTRRASVRAMDEATELYGQALQRLAHR